MEEQRVYFNAGNLRLEGLFCKGGNRKGVVITHPHPLYGGDMYNNIVSAIAWAYNRCGYSTLRVNFRGVGASEGSYDDGVGEQDDVAAAIEYLRSQEIPQVALAGYSFGAWVISKGLEQYGDVEHIVMVSPPAAFLKFEANGREPRIGLVVTGSNDDIAPPMLARNLLSDWNPEGRLKVIQGADHFYWGQEHEVSKAIEEYLSGK